MAILPNRPVAVRDARKLLTGMECHKVDKIIPLLRTPKRYKFQQPITVYCIWFRAALGALDRRKSIQSSH